MTIKTSAAGQVDALIADLASDRALIRDAAVARLSVIGTRAIARLVTLALDAGARRAARIAALRVLEGNGDAKACEAAAGLIDDQDVEVATAAVLVTRAAMTGPRGVAAVDRLASVALDAARPDVVREAAIAALGGLQFGTVSPLLAVLSADRAPRIRDAAQRLVHRDRGEGDDPALLIAAAARGERLEDPESLRLAIVRAGRSAALPDLRQIVEAARERETSAAPSWRSAWLQVRAAAHAALARRGSRLAVFDLRESLASSVSALPVEFIAALVAVGDASCLEAIAAGWDRANKGRGDPWWQRHLADAFRAIVAREGLTRRHGAIKRIEKRWPLAAGALLTAAHQ